MNYKDCNVHTILEWKCQVQGWSIREFHRKSTIKMYYHLFIFLQLCKEKDWELNEFNEGCNSLTM